MKTVRFLTILVVASLAVLGVAGPFCASAAATTTLHAQAPGIVADDPLPPPPFPW